MIGLVLASILWFQAAPAAPAQNGVIAGQIRSRDNSPATSVQVGAYPVPTGSVYSENNGMGFAARLPVSTTVSDSQGRYRITNIPPGNYYIMAGLVSAPTYYPDATDQNGLQPIVVPVAKGQTVDGMNFNLLAEPGIKVSGSMKLYGGIAPGQTATLTSSRIDEFLEVPVKPDMTFEFARVPSGTYLLGTFPPPPGVLPIAVSVGSSDIGGLVLTSPPTHTVTGRIVIQGGGPIPEGILGFYTEQSYIGATINPDGTFSVKLHSALHRVDVAGMPIGYSAGSVRFGGTDLSRGLTVGNADMSDIAVTIIPPPTRPRVQGRVTGLTGTRLTSAKVQMNGPIFGTLEAAIQPDGSFEFAKVVPGLYIVNLLQVAEFKPIELVVTDKPITQVQLAVPAR